jgi:hypothetical protein
VSYIERCPHLWDKESMFWDIPKRPLYKGIGISGVPFKIHFVKHFLHWLITIVLDIIMEPPLNSWMCVACQLVHWCGTTRLSHAHFQLKIN